MQRKTADLICTSPPYDQQRSYISGAKPWDAMMQSVCSNLPTHDRTQIIVNLAPFHKAKEWQAYWTNWIEWMRSHGWRAYGWYVWDKLAAMPGEWHGQLGGQCFEFLFHFNKQAITVNRTKPKIPSSIAYNSRKGSLRQLDGRMHEPKNRAAYLATHKIPNSSFASIPTNRTDQQSSAFIRRGIQSHYRWN